MGEWIKCSERMPEYFCDVLITDGKHVEVKWWDGDEWDCWGDSYWTEFATHWMPLPEPPEV